MLFIYFQSYMQIANDQDRLKDLLESSLSQVEDYACSIRETTVQNIAPDNIRAVTQMNAALLSIEELALQLEHFVLMCKEKLKEIVPEALRSLQTMTLTQTMLSPLTEFLPQPLT